jgi:hypothetical protein
MRESRKFITYFHDEQLGEVSTFIVFQFHLDYFSQKDNFVLRKDHPYLITGGSSKTKRMEKDKEIELGEIVIWDLSNASIVGIVPNLHCTSITSIAAYYPKSKEGDPAIITGCLDGSVTAWKFNNFGGDNSTQSPLNQIWTQKKHSKQISSLAVYSLAPECSESTASPLVISNIVSVSHGN